ncbi:MAG: cation:proton antiporter [Candidatus Binatia bacterium]
MKRKLVVLWFVLAVSLCAVTLAEKSGHPYDWNHPRPEEYRPPGKPYKPLRQPPGALLPRQHHTGNSKSLDAQVVASLAGIFILAIGTQWLASLARIPTALLLVAGGVVAGPVTGLLDPDVLFGNLLLPVVSLSLALVLFLEALSAGRSVWDVRSPVIELAGVGMLICWLISAAAAYLVLDCGFPLAVLLGAILAMTGPPAAVGLCRRRRAGQLNAVLTGEGIALDLIGSVLVILILKALVVGGFRQFSVVSVLAARDTLAVGILCGMLGGGALYVLLKRQWIPQSLARSLCFMLVIGVFAVSNTFQTDSGFLAVIAMGVLLSSQEIVPAKRIVQLYGNLYESLIAAVIIVLFARVSMADFIHLGVAGGVFVGIAIVAARPLAVGLSTVRLRFDWRERIGLSVMGPRGLLPAGLSAICTFRLIEIGDWEATILVPLSLLVVAGTVIACAAASPFVARWEQEAVELDAPGTPQASVNAGTLA